MLTEKASKIATRLSQGEIFFASREPRLSPIIRDELRALGLEISSDRCEDVRFFASNLDLFRKTLARLVKQ